MRTIETKLFNFNELNKESQDNAIEAVIEYKQQHGEPLYLFDEVYNDEFTNLGFTGTEIQYSLSYCQGDGLSFSAESYDKLEELCLEVLGKGKEKTARLISDNINFSLKGNTGCYCYASKSDLELFFDYSSSNLYMEYENIDSIIDKVEEKLQKIYLDLCKKLENIGYEEIDYYYSDEAIIEDIEANGYEFTEDGAIY